MLPGSPLECQHVGVILVPRARTGSVTRVLRGTTECCSPRGKHADQNLRTGEHPTRAAREEGAPMDVVYPHCCGLDIHKKLVVACVLTPGAHGQPQKEIRTFGTMTADLLELAAWLQAAGCTHVAMEATGVVRREVAIC